MLLDHKVIVCTPAGRKKYLEILIQYILRENIIDEYHLWLNTENNDDINYINELKNTYPNLIKIIEKTNKSLGGIDGISQFYKNCIDTKTVYLKLDDDIVFISKDGIKNLLSFKIQNPQYFIVFGNIINNCICLHLHQRIEAVNLINALVEWDAGAIKKLNNNFINELHKLFQENYKTNKFIFNNWKLYYEHVSINAISWLGEEFSKFNGNIEGWDESFLSVTKSKETGKHNVIFGESIFVHYAFSWQHVDPNRLETYKNICNGTKPFLI